MTPKEKASQLTRRFLSMDNDRIRVYGFTMRFFYAKDCALIAVDEVISVIDPETNFKTWEFYKQVKQEIEKL